jgi:hypothetical protein
MPVQIQICWDLDVWHACVSSVCAGMALQVLLEASDGLWLEKWAEFGSRSRGPPSSERETWSFVSFVLRSRKAMRGRSAGGAIC